MGAAIRRIPGWERLGTSTDPGERAWVRTVLAKAVLAHLKAEEQAARAR